MLDLASVAELIVESASASGLPIFEEIPDLSRIPTVRWAGEPRAFIELAQKSQARLLYLEVWRHDPEGVVEGIVRGQLGEDEVEEETTHDEESTSRAAWLREIVMEAIAPWDQRREKIQTVTAVWIQEGIAHELEVEAEWSDALGNAIRGVLAHIRSVAREDGVEHSRESALRLHDLATQLAAHPRFSEANSQEKREFMAQRIYGQMATDDYPSMSIGAIARRAALIYWWDFEPSERATIAERVRALKKQGQSARSIAAVLNISDARVRAALQEAAE